MAEQNSILTETFRISLAKLIAGEANTIPPVTQIAFGDGGVNDTGDPIPPSIEQSSLTHEVCRYPVAAPTFPVETTAQFTAIIPKDEQTGIKFSEMSLVNSAGSTVAIKAMYVKQKDANVEFAFTYELEF